MEEVNWMDLMGLMDFLQSHLRKGYAKFLTTDYTNLRGVS